MKKQFTIFGYQIELTIYPLRWQDRVIELIKNHPAVIIVNKNPAITGKIARIKALREYSHLVPDLEIDKRDDGIITLVAAKNFVEKYFYSEG